MKTYNVILLIRVLLLYSFSNVSVLLIHCYYCFFKHWHRVFLCEKVNALQQNLWTLWGDPMYNDKLHASSFTNCNFAHFWTKEMLKNVFDAWYETWCIIINSYWARKYQNFLFIEKSQIYLIGGGEIKHWAGCTFREYDHGRL